MITAMSNLPPGNSQTAALQHQLSTPEGFAQAVAAPKGLRNAAIGVFLFGLFCIGMNIFQLGTASDWHGGLMGRFFFDAQALEFTGSRAGRGAALRYLWVWGPVVLIPLAIILIVVYLLGRKSRGANLFNDFQQRGWVARQFNTGLKVKIDRNTIDVAISSHPSVPDQDYNNIVSGFMHYVANLDPKAQKALSTTARKAGVAQGVSASALDPNLPAVFTAAPPQGKTEFVVVIPPANGKPSPVKVLGIKAP